MAATAIRSRGDSIGGTAVRALVIAVVCGVMLGSSSGWCWGASAAGGASGGWFTDPIDVDVHTWSNPSPYAAAAATITWTAGPNTADGTTFTHWAAGHENAYSLVEPKFNTANWPPTLGARTFTGIFFDDVGVWGSHAINNGYGHSEIRPAGTLATYYARFYAFAGGSLGSGTPPPPIEYSSQTYATDPWPIFDNDLTYLTDTRYSLYVPVALTEGYVDQPGSNAAGSIGWLLNYRTADVSDNLLDVSVVGNHASVTGSPTAAYYLMADMDNDLTTAPADLITLAELETMINDDLAPDGDIDSPIMIGVYLDNIAKPTVDMGDDVVAWVSFGVRADASDAVPEPSVLGLLASGLAGMAWLRRRRGRTRSAR